MTLFFVSTPKPVCKTLCEACGIANAPQRCSRCHSVCFCDEICQREFWPKHKARCDALATLAAKACYDEPTAESLTAEVRTDIKYAEAVQRCGLTTKSKMVFVFWTPRSPYGQKHFATTGEKEPAHNNQRVNIFTLREFQRLGFFEHNKETRKTVSKVLALKHAKGVWAAVICQDDGCIGVKGGLYE